MKRNIAYVILSAALVAASLTFVACGKDLTDTHTYADAWSADRTSHWHACTAGGHDDTAGKEVHRFDSGTVTEEPTQTKEGKLRFVCGTCGYVKTETLEKLPQEESYTITFDSTGGTEVAPVRAPAGAAVTAPTAPTREGYIFDGWYESADNGATLAGTPFVFSYMPARVFTLYAKWVKPTVKGQTYKVSDVTFTWGSAEEKADFDEEADATEEEFIELYKSMHLTLVFDDGETVTVFFEGRDGTETARLFYSTDAAGVMTFYQTAEDKAAGTAFSGYGLFMFTFTVSDDCTRITLSTNVRPSSVLQIVCLPEKK